MKKRSFFTEEELEAMRQADAEIEDDFRLTQEDIERSRRTDRASVLERMDPGKRKIAENQRAYYEANREKWNTYMREYQRKRRAANRSEGSGQRQEQHMQCYCSTEMEKLQ